MAEEPNDHTYRNPDDHVVINRDYWDSMADDWVSAGVRSWKQPSPTWGIWALPEAELGMLPNDMHNLRAIELGCGTGYVSAWMARRGADVVGLDNSIGQLKTATRLMHEHQLQIFLIHGNAECVPCPDASFDFAISEYGAAIWCDPLVWIPEAYRLLKPGGTLAFLGTHPIAMLAMPLDGGTCDERLHRPYLGMHKFDWREVEIDPGGFEFNLSLADWLKLFRETGFEVTNYQELRAQARAPETKFSIPGEWARQWPSEQVWQLTKTQKN